MTSWHGQGKKPNIIYTDRIVIFDGVEAGREIERIYRKGVAKWRIRIQPYRSNARVWRDLDQVTFYRKIGENLPREIF